MPPREETDAAEIDWSAGTVSSIDIDEADKSAQPPSAQGVRMPVRKGPPPPPPLKPKTTRPDARLIDEGEIARGGMGTIRRVQDALVLRHAALKILDEKDGRKDARPRFIREVQIMAQLDHPNIVPVYDLGTTTDGVPAFTMKLVAGKTLTRHLVEHNIHQDSRELEEVLRILSAVCDALAFAHSRGVVHRDLKPDNIMIGTFGQVYLMDWGCAGVMTDEQLDRSPSPDMLNRVRCHQVADLDAPSTVIGTANYMPPEQAWGKADEPDVRSDVFSLGAILYEVLTRKPPFRGKSALETVRMAQVCDIKPAEQVAPRDIPRGLCRIVTKATSREMSARYQSIQDLKADLERFVRGGAWFASRPFASGTIIVREGDEADAAYIITHGACEVYKTENGRKVPLRRLGPGDVFGETAIFTSQPRSATVEAIDDVVAMVVTRDMLDDELSMESWVGAFVRALAERFRDLDGKMSAMRLAHGRTLVREQVRNQLMKSGSTVADGVREIAWSPLKQKLQAELGLTDDDLITILAQSSDLSVDEQRDVIVMELPKG